MLRALASAGLAMGLGIAGSYETMKAQSANSSTPGSKQHHKYLIVGGGTGGLTVASQLGNKEANADIAVIEPSSDHYYQPMWTMVGGGMFPKQASVRPMKDFMPASVTWLKDSVKSFFPEKNSVQLANGQQITYDYMVVAAGLQINWSKIPGLLEALNDPSAPVASIYDYTHAEKVWSIMSNLKSGKAIFTQPSTGIKCGGAPQKIMWLSEANFRERGVRSAIDVVFALPQAKMFAVQKYGDALEKMRKEKNVDGWFGKELVSIDSNNRVATFKAADGKTTSEPFEALHVVPPMGAMDFIKSSSLANEAGFVSVDKETLQHTKFSNVFALGDCSSLPTSKTAAAITAQAPVLVHNLMNVVAGKKPTAKYDGYTSCPILVGDNKLILAEFLYGGKPSETFPWNQAIPSRFAFHLKKDLFPMAYWRWFVTGKWYGKDTFFEPKF